MNPERILKMVPTEFFRLRWAGKKTWYIRQDNYWTAEANQALTFATRRSAEKHLRRIGKKHLAKVEPFTREVLRKCAA